MRCVRTASTPGARSASAVSIDVMRPLATVLRTTAACATFGTVELGGVGGAAGDLLPAVDAADGLSDEGGGHARAPAVSTARTMARCMSSILKSLCPQPLRALGGERRRRAERCRVEAGAGQRRLDPGDAPGLGPDPAQGDARLPDAGAVHLERHRGRHDRELEGGPVAHLEVVRAPCRRAGRHRDGGDHLARLEHRLEVRGGVGQAVEVDERHGALPAGPAHLDRRVERHQRHREVRGVGGDAMLARAEHGVPAVLAADGGAAGARCALVAGGVADIAEVGAAGPLQEVAADGRLVAHLRAGRVQQRLGDDGEPLDHGGVRRHLRHRGGGAEPEPLRPDVDAAVEEAREADQPLGPAHLFLQQLHHVGAAGDVLGGRVVAAGLGARGEGGGQVARPFEE